MGGFLWLKAFDSVTIQSVFRDGQAYLERTFNFLLSANGIEGGEIFTPSKHNSLKTTVHLKGFKKDFEEQCPKKPTTIAHKIIEHCLSVFLSDNCPNIFLVDDSNKIDLKLLFQKEYQTYSSTCIFKVGSEAFSMTSMKLLRSSDPYNHRMHYCANNREVSSEPLKDDIPDLNHKITTTDGEPFSYLTFVSGEYLDKSVNSERTDFNIPKEPTSLLKDIVTLSDIKLQALKEVRSQLQEFLLPIQEQKRDRIQTFVQTKAPEYRHILKYEKESLDHIAPDITDDSLEIELHRIHHKLELDVKMQSKEYVNTKPSDIRNYPEYRERYNRFFEKLNDVGKANIAKYVIHRKIVLDILENNLKQKDNDKYAIEESIHEIIFPLRTTSDDITYGNQNLWVLDEKLSYHYFLASDKKLKNMEIIEVESDNRPDLLIFNNPCAFVDQKSDFSSIVIVEFKRPMRNNYTGEDDNPIAQVYNYVRELRNGGKSDKNGRPVRIKENTPVYAYLICDVTQKINTYAVDAGLDITPDLMGYFGFNKGLQTYIEVLSYDKVLADSQKRNRVLFDQLNIS